MALTTTLCLKTIFLGRPHFLNTYRRSFKTYRIKRVIFITVRVQLINGDIRLESRGLTSFTSKHSALGNLRIRLRSLVTSITNA